MSHYWHHFWLQLWLMESPRWLLLSSGRRDEAVAALTCARGKYGGDTAAVEAEVAGIEDSLRATSDSGGEQLSEYLHEMSAARWLDGITARSPQQHQGGRGLLLVGVARFGGPLTIKPCRVWHSERALNRNVALRALRPKYMMSCKVLRLRCVPPGIGALFSGRNLRPLLIGSSLMLFQQITGQPSVLYYATKIFEVRAGLGFRV